MYAAAGSLRAVRFDLARLDVLSDPVPVVEHVSMAPSGAANYAISRLGTLVYVSGDGAGTQTPRRLMWVDRKGHEEPITAQRLTTSANFQYPNSVTSDGTHVLGYESGYSAPDVVQFALDGVSSARGAGASAESVQRPSEPLVKTTFTEWNAEISPDGRYFAYQSNESGKDEVYVRPYPKVNDGRWQVSSGGGTRPAWARNGRELFFVDLINTLMSVPVHTIGPTFSYVNPAQVFDTKYAMPVPMRTYDVSPDGQRFLMIKEGTADGNAPPSLVVVEHWFEELQRLVPTRP